MRKSIIGFAISVYALLGYLLFGDDLFGKLDFLVLLALAGIVLCVTILNILLAIFQVEKAMKSETLQRQLNHWPFALKLIMIPFFFINFALGSLLTGLLFFLPAWLIVAALWCLQIVLSYLVLLSSSAYTIAGLVVQYRHRRLPLWHMIVHILLQLIFLTDVVSSILIHHKIRKAMKHTATNNASR